MKHYLELFCINSLENMKDKAKEEANKFESELKELTLMHEKSKKTGEFNFNKNLDDSQTNFKDFDNENTLKKNAHRLLKERAVDQKLLEKHRKLELDYAKIQATTKIATYDELMQVFIDIEEKNFKSFQFINELCNQIELFETQINALKSIILFYFLISKLININLEITN